MGVLTDDFAGAKVVEYARVQNPNTYTVHAHIRSEQDIPTVVHDSESALSHRVA